MAGDKAEHSDGDIFRFGGCEHFLNHISVGGLPQELPKANTANEVLSESNKQLAATAIVQSKQRPDAWDVADSAMELGIAVAGLFGGAGAVRFAKFMQDAKAKSNALKEVVLANEIFKKTNPDSADAFKDAQRNQSVLTKQLVGEVKSGA